MKDLKEEFIKGLSSGCSSLCPENIGLKNRDCDGVNDDCEICWRHALKNVSIINIEESR